MLTVKKAVNDIVAVLQTKESPVNKGENIWNSLMAQSEEEGTWDDKLIKAIEKEIGTYLGSIKENEVRLMWNKSSKGLASFEDFETMSIKQIKADLTDECMDRIMDKLGGGNGDSNDYRGDYFVTEEEEGFSEKEEDEDDKDFGYKDGGEEFLNDNDIFGEDDVFDDEKF